MRQRRSTRQIAEIAAVLTTAFAQVGLRPVLVGGAAVELYSEGGYATSDLDMVLLNDPLVNPIMRDLGFEKPIRGERSWHHPKLRLTVEFPSSSLAPEEETIQVQTRMGVFYVVSREDLAVDRLNSYAYWGSTVDGLNVLLLMMQDDFNLAKFRRKLQGSELLQHVNRFSRLVKDVAAGKRTFDNIAKSLIENTEKWQKRKQ